jgi:hypothetical protein
MRTALGVLGYSLTVLRLFDRHFYRGMRAFYTFFSSPPLIALHLFLSFRVSRLVIRRPLLLVVCLRVSPRTPFAARLCGQDDAGDDIPAIRTVGQEHKRLFGRPFVTAGRIVALVACIVAATEIALLVLILQL